MNDSNLFLVSEELQNKFDESVFEYEKKEKIINEIIDIQNLCDVLRISKNKLNTIKIILKFNTIENCKKYFLLNKNCNYKILFDENVYILKDVLSKKINVKKKILKLEVLYVE